MKRCATTGNASRTETGRAISNQKNSLEAFQREAASVQKELEDSAAAHNWLQLAQDELESTLKKLSQDVAFVEQNYPFGPPSPLPTRDRNSIHAKFVLRPVLFAVACRCSRAQAQAAFLQDIQTAPLACYRQAYTTSVIYLKSRKTKIEIEIKRTEIKALHLLLKQRRLAARQEWSSVRSESNR